MQDSKPETLIECVPIGEVISYRAGFRNGMRTNSWLKE